MATFLDSISKILVQGITGSEGTKHTRRMVASGSDIVALVNPRMAVSNVDGMPVFRSVEEAVAETGANVSVVFVPPTGAKAAIQETVDAGVPLCVVITEGIPVHDSTQFWAYACSRSNATRIIGPNCPGLISPEQSNAGIIPASITKRGPVSYTHLEP